jgi:uncharacterized phage protein gp47/JayE
MGFQRESAESILDKMVSWARAVSPKLTDFRRGSVIRTIFESVALVIEGSYNKFYTSLKSIIESNIYAVIGFDKTQAVPSSGNVTFGRNTAADIDFTIPKGTAVVAQSNNFRPPITFRTTIDAVLKAGYTTVDVPVVCTEAGAITNTLAGEINSFVSKPVGIDTVTNSQGFTNGVDEESPEDQKARFATFMGANTRGTLQAIEYGAKLATVLDSNGLVSEKVIQAVASEDTVNNKGVVSLYVWNGVGAPSQALQDAIQKILLGYYDDQGNRVYGYKNGGTLVNIYQTNTSSVTIKLTLTIQSWADLDTVKNLIQNEMTSYFNSLKPGQTLMFSEVLSRVKAVSGVLDVIVALSTDGGTTYNTNNVTVSQNTINVLNTINYA